MDGTTSTEEEGAASAFALPERLAAKADPALVAADEEHFAEIAASLARTLADLTERIAAASRAPARAGQEALEKDLEVHRLTARLRALRRFGLDLCLGHMVPADGSGTVYVGRLGLTDAEGRRLLVDWRSPVAEAFFGATHAHPMGLTSRRRYRWTGGRVTDYWDEVFTPEGLAGRAALDDQSAFVASLGSTRSARMRDVLATIAADQDAVIRAGSRGALVVDGGPGTGKTVVALHRTAYLLYSDPRLGHHRGGVLFLGPSDPYLAYVGDVLPRLGEEGVRTCTVRDLLPEGVDARPEVDPEVARLKSSAAMAGAVEPAVRLYEEPPTEVLTVTTELAEVRLGPDDWAEAFSTPDPGTPHNDARDEVWEALLDVVVDRLGGEDADEDLPDEEQFDAYRRGAEGAAARFRRSFAASRELTETFERAWPLLDPAELVSDLWAVPAYLRRCAPWLTPEEVRLLRRPEAAPWTVEDLPLLDAARMRVGDPDAARGRRRRESVVAAERERMDQVVDDLIATDDSEMRVMSMLRGQDLQGALVDPGAAPAADPDVLAGPFAHVVVDEAQELTDAQWQMVLRRCPSRSLTIVGDRAQARHGFTESWQERLGRVGLDRVTIASLGINYRTPEEVMAAAEPVIRAALPDANVPTSVRRGGLPVVHGRAADRDHILGTWLATHDEGVACVVNDPTFAPTARARSLSAVLTRGLEFDLVVLVDPDGLGDGIEGAVDRYVSMTRATQQLVVLRD